MNLKDIFKALGLPVGLLGVVTAVLLWVGLTVDQITGVVLTLVGVQLCISLLVDVLKYAGVITPGASGQWSAGLNLALFVAVAVQLKLYPAFDIQALDAQLFEFAKVAGLVLGYIVQIYGTKRWHEFNTQTLGIKAFSFKVLRA